MRETPVVAAPELIQPRPVSKEAIGILGGMGPLASAAFVRSIYSMYRGQKEQDTPVVLLYSDPRVPDRTAALSSGEHQGPLLQAIEGALSCLIAIGAQRLIICCMTAHCLLRSLSPHVQTRVISLVDLLLQRVRATQGRCLLVSTTGTRKARVLQQHYLWPELEPRIVLPADDEQAALHEAIYELKQGHDVARLGELVAAVASRHRVERIAAACTELHLLSAIHTGPTDLNTRFEIVDPLTAIAQIIREERDEATVRP